jgi:hypothetical protein
MPQELLFELDDVRITPTLAQFGETSYQIASISSVRATQGKKLSRVAVFVFLLGLGLFVAALAKSGSEGSADANFPAAAIAVGTMFLSVLVQLLLPRRTFKLVLRTHGGDVEVLTSYRRKFVLDVKHAVEAAFVARAQR